MTTEILCRVDRATRTPVVFITDTVDYEKNTVDSWIKGEPQTVSLNYYHSTGPLSAADEEVLRQRYARNFNDNEVVVRHRLPRTKKELENILAQPGRRPRKLEAVAPVEPAPAVAPAPVESAPTPQQIFAALEQMRVETAQQIAGAMAQLNAAIASQRPVRKGKPRVPRAVVATSRKPAARKLVSKV